MRYLDFFAGFVGRVGKQFNKKAKIFFKIFDVISCERNKLQYAYCPIFQKLEAFQTKKIIQVKKDNINKIFLKKSYPKWGG